MSKVKIQGNASGTGIFTVAAPATNTDRTITLPDVDATVMTTAGGTISGVTQISNPTETGYASTLAETVSKATLKIKTHSTNSTLTTFGGISDGDAYIQRSNGPGTSSYNLRLNPFGGAVLIPNQPAFNVQMNNANYSSVSTPQTVVYDDVYVNRGSHYSTSTGRFTALIPGAYFFAWHMLGRNLTSGGRTALYLNGSLYGSGNSHTYSGLTGESMHSATAIVSMNANDYVDVRVWTGGAGDFYGNSNCHNGFSGFLIG